LWAKTTRNKLAQSPFLIAEAKQSLRIRAHNDTKYLINLCNSLVIEAIVVDNQPSGWRKK
jgi:hypothetical protein